MAVCDGAHALLHPPVAGATGSVAVFVGTFDPLHDGHLAAAQACLDAGVGEVLFVPNLAARKPRASARRHRVSMAAAAVDGRAGMNVLRAEPDMAQASGCGWSLRRLRAQVRALYGGKRPVAELHGSDPFAAYPPERHAGYFDGQTLYVVSRPPHPAPAALPAGTPGRVVPLAARLPHSSSALRARIRAGAPLPDLLAAGLVGAAQLRYARAHGLYAPPAPPRGAGCSAAHDADVAVVGGGPAGLVAAIAIVRGSRRPVRVLCLEKQGPGRDTSEGTSMTLTLAGLKALRRVDDVLCARVEAAGVPVRTLRLCNGRGEGQELELADASGALPRQLLRPQLMELCRERAAELGVGVRYNSGASGFSIDSDGVSLRSGDTGVDPVTGAAPGAAGGAGVRARAMIVADGHFSRTRNMLLDDGWPTYSGHRCWRMLADGQALTAGGSSVRVFGPGGVHVFLRPTGGGQTAVDVVAPEAELPHPAPDRPAAVARQSMLSRCRGIPAEVLELLEAVPAERIIERGVYHRVASKRWGAARATTLGDAAHPSLPNTDQNWGATMRDCLALGECFQLDSVEAGLRAYEARRVPEQLRDQARGLRLRWELDEWLADAAAPAPLLGVTYISEAPWGDADALRHITAAAERRNAEENITGFLAHVRLGKSPFFVQTIEGPEDAVSSLFDDICADPRHVAPALIEREPLWERAYGGWAMRAVAAEVPAPPAERPREWLARRLRGFRGFGVRDGVRELTRVLDDLGKKGRARL